MARKRIGFYALLHSCLCGNCACCVGIRRYVGSVRVNMLILVALQRNTLSCSRSARSRVISSRRRTTLVVRLASPRKRDCSSGPLMMNGVYVTWVD